MWLKSLPPLPIPHNLTLFFHTHTHFHMHHHHHFIAQLMTLTFEQPRLPNSCSNRRSRSGIKLQRANRGELNTRGGTRQGWVIKTPLLRFSDLIFFLPNRVRIEGGGAWFQGQNFTQVCNTVGSFLLCSNVMFISSHLAAMGLLLQLRALEKIISRESTALQQTPIEIDSNPGWWGVLFWPEIVGLSLRWQNLTQEIAFQNSQCGGEPACCRHPHAHSSSPAIPMTTPPQPDPQSQERIGDSS